MSVALRIKPRVAGVLPQETRLRIANEHKVCCILTRALGGLCRSGSFARVKMMQATDLWELDHLAKRGRLDSSADRHILVGAGQAFFRSRSFGWEGSSDSASRGTRRCTLE
jgi:hypothetical protein